MYLCVCILFERRETLHEHTEQNTEIKDSTVKNHNSETLVKHEHCFTEANGDKYTSAHDTNMIH